MTSYHELFINQEIKYQDEKYLKALERCKEIMDANQLTGTTEYKKLTRKIYMVKEINSGKVRIQKGAYT